MKVSHSAGVSGVKKLLETGLFVLTGFIPMLLLGQAGYPDSFDPGPNSTVNIVTIQNDGNILVAGSFTSIGHPAEAHTRLARVSATGVVESSFQASADAQIDAIAVANDGGIILGGFFSTVSGVSKPYLARLYGNGQLDEGFSPSVNGPVNAIVVQGDGKILIGGSFTSVNGLGRGGLARLDSNGNLDLGFHPDVGQVYAIRLQGSSILIGGLFADVDGSPRGNLARLSTDGIVDPAFAPTANGWVDQIELNGTTKILVAGVFTSVNGQPRNYVASMDLSGGLDTWNPGADNRVRAIGVQSDGKVVLAGDFFNIGGLPRSGVARMNSDGTAEAGFDSHCSGFVNDLAIQADGQIVVGGYFNSFGTLQRTRLARLNRDAVSGVPAQITSPAPGSTLSGANVTFTWNTGTNVTGYTLWVGSTPGGYDFYAGNEGGGMSKALTLPTDGRTIYATLYSPIGGAFQTTSATFTAYSAPAPVKARLTSPVNGSALSSNSLTLVWDGGFGVTSYYLFVGTVAGGNDLYSGNEGTNTTKTINNLPADRRIYVTLWSLIKGAYQPNYYAFDSFPSTKASLASPANGSVLTGNTLALSWNAGVGASGYALWLGSAPGGYDLGAASAGTGTSWTFSGVPRDGGPVYLTLWSLINGGWQRDSYWFTTALPVSGNRAAILTSPENTSTLGSATLNLTWDAGIGATNYALWVGSTPNGYDLYAALETGYLRSVPIPGDGRRIYVTLHSLIGGAYQSNAYCFTVPNLPDAGAAQVTAPTVGSTLTDATLPLTWSSAAGATQYYLFVGSSPGAYDLYAGSQGASLSRTVTGMPLDGRPVYVTLYSWLNNTWKPSSAWFTSANTAGGNKRALMTSPTNGTTLAGAGTTFTWGGGVGVSQYALWIGSSPAGYDLWASAEGAATSRNVTTLPTDGRKLYVTLYSMIGGVWQAASYQFTAANVAITKAAVTSPTPGSTLPGSSATFTWSASNGATAYALWIGRNPGGYDVYAGAEGTSLSRTVSTLPVDGGPVYVTIWSLIKGAWQSTEAIYQAALPP